MPPDVIERLKNLHLDETIREREIVLTLWDFAGQHLYYASHGIFMTIAGLYLLIYDMSKDLHAPAEAWVNQGGRHIPLENESNQTNLEILLSWLACVHSICHADSDASDGRTYLPPPVMIIGTHAADCENPEEMEELIRKNLEGKEYYKHVVRPFFRIENSNCDDALQEIQDKIAEILHQESYLGQRVYVKWFHFEKVGGRCSFSCVCVCVCVCVCMCVWTVR